MGVRRKSRARIAAINKAGLKKDVTPSPLVISNNIVEASQFRQGQMVVTDLVLDLASTKNTLYSKAAAAADPIGTNDTNVSYVCNLGESVFGIVTQVETISLEQCTDGTLKDYDLMYAGDGTLDGHASSGNDGYLGSDATGDNGLATDIFASAGSAVGKHTTTQVDTSVSARGLQNRYLYITAGDVTTAKATATIDVSSATVGNVKTGITRIRLTADDESEVDFVADSGTAYGGSPAANKFMIGSATTTAHLSEGIAKGINNNANFSASPTDGSSTTITVTVANVTATSNNTNYLTDDATNASGIDVGNFTGGMPNEITAGKLLIRVTGWIDPDDL